MKNMHESKIEAIAECYIARRDGGATDEDAAYGATAMAENNCDSAQIAAGIRRGRRRYAARARTPA